MTPWINTPRIAKILDDLYIDAEKSESVVRKVRRETGATEAQHYRAARHVYMAVNREFGNLLYTLARSSRAKTIVEFGTSFGVSTIFLAAALRDNGGGKVITTEFEPSKVERAQKNLADAGLVNYVEFRIGDVLKTLSVPPREIDLLFLDGAKTLYYDVLKLVEPYLRPDGIVASDNTDHEALKAFLEYVRNPRNGYTSSPIRTGDDHNRGHEISLRH